jgi:hypothetical protein
MDELILNEVTYTGVSVTVLILIPIPSFVIHLAYNF